MVEAKMSSFQMIGTTTPFKNWTKSTIRNPDRSDSQIPVYSNHRSVSNCGKVWISNGILNPVKKSRFLTFSFNFFGLVF